MAEEKTADKDPNQGESTQVRVRWDDSKMVNTYANVCNVQSTREELTLLFGTNKNWHQGQTDLTVELTNRVILNPFAAKRLFQLLGNVLKEYESRFGELSGAGSPGATGVPEQGANS